MSLLSESSVCCQEHSSSDPHPSRLPQQQRNNSSTLHWTAVGLVAAVLVGVFSTYFPFVADFTWGEVSPRIYQNAWYHYDERASFDNDPLTYITDYIIAATMVWWARSIGKQQPQQASSSPHSSDRIPAQLWRAHVVCSRGLLLSYATSVLAGAIAHQWFETTEQLNTFAFRFLWTVCVGSVAAASGWMGSLASLWAQYDEYHECAVIPNLPRAFWTTFAAVTTAVVVWGGWSYQRPACDIFVAGITQFPSTFYVMVLLGKGMPTLTGLSPHFRWAGMVAFILNAILLPAYPWLVATSLTVGQVNALMHGWLLLSWSSQAYVLRHVARSMERTLQAPDIAVPILKHHHHHHKAL
jgi:hypothetical protein